MVEYYYPLRELILKTKKANLTLHALNYFKLITTLDQCANANEFRHTPTKVGVSALASPPFHAYFISRGISF